MPSLPRTNLNAALQAQHAQLIKERHVQEELLAEVGHDLKSPLTALLGLLNLLEQGDVDNLTERQQHYLKLMGVKSHQLMDTVKTVLLLSEAQRQRLTLAPDIVDIHALCQQVIEVVRRQVFEAQPSADLSLSSITLDVDADLSSLIADRCYLQRILADLLGDILMAGHPGRLVVESLGGWIRFTLSADQEALLDRSQLQPSEGQLRQLTRSLASHLAHLQQGTIIVDPVRLQVTIILPSNVAALCADPTLGRQWSQHLALVVADLHTSSIPIDDLLNTLTNSDYQGVVVPLRDAIATARQLQPAAIFLAIDDIQQSGWEMLSLLKESAPPTPIIALGQMAQRQQAEQEQNIETFLSFPIEAQAVATCLATVIADPSKTSAIAAEGSAAKRLGQARTIPPTLLYLDTDAQQSSTSTDLSQHLNHHGFRVVTAGNLAEATLLTPIWKPKVVLYTSADPSPLDHLEPASLLTTLPFVVVDPQVAKICQERNLTVYQSSSSMPLSLSETELVPLIESLQAAVGANANGAGE